MLILMMERLSAHRVGLDHILQLVQRFAPLVNEGHTYLPMQRSAEIVLREHILTHKQCLAALVPRGNI